MLHTGNERLLEAAEHGIVRPASPGTAAPGRPSAPTARSRSCCCSCGVPAEAQLRDQADDGRRRDAGDLREPGRRLQPGGRVVRQQRLRHPQLARGQRAAPRAQRLGHRRHGAQNFQSTPATIASGIAVGEARRLAAPHVGDASPRVRRRNRRSARRPPRTRRSRSSTSVGSASMPRAARSSSVERRRVDVDRLGQPGLLVDAGQSGEDQRGDHEVRIRGEVEGLDLEVGRASLAARSRRAPPAAPSRGSPAPTPGTRRPSAAGSAAGSSPGTARRSRAARAGAAGCRR